MPPQRTMPPTKTGKTERTHEENQERAYIAASRRSDRSLEARIESARRASAIHKRRTGRALRVTEQDVINEEMYEEEEDEYYGYRGLTTHFRNSSYDVNRRLQAYLQNQYVTHAMVAEGGNPPPHQYSGMPSNYIPPFMQQPMISPYANATMQSAQLSPTTYASLRQQPYPSPGGPPQRYQRAMSMQMHQSPPLHLQTYQPGVPYTNQHVYTAPPTPTSGISLTTTSQYSAQVMPQHQSGITAQQFPQHAISQAEKSSTRLDFDESLFASFPFTPTLPPETQQFLQPVDQNDPLYPALMAGHSATPLFGFSNGTNDLKSTATDATSSLTTRDLQSSPLSYSSMTADPRCMNGSGTDPLFDPQSSCSAQSSTSLEPTPVSPRSEAGIASDSLISQWRDLIEDEPPLWPVERA